jgi:DNA integrity scanning protein DisA with diadenylate cyclase activity
MNEKIFVEVTPDILEKFKGVLDVYLKTVGLLGLQNCVELVNVLSIVKTEKDIKGQSNEK